MWTLLALPWQACLEEAWGAFCAGSLPIGACTTDAYGQILTRGRNRCDGPEGKTPDVHHNVLAHAELNALLALQLPYDERKGITLYTTTEPCPLCMGALYMSGVHTLHYAAREAYSGSTDLLCATPYMSRKPINVFGPPDPHLEALITAIAVEVRLSSWRKAHPDVIEAWREMTPQAVTLGEWLYESGELRRMCADGWSAEQAVEALYGMVPG